MTEPPARMKTNAAQLKTLSLLYVEDNDDIRTQLAQYLRRRMGALFIAANGQEGLEAYQRHHPDLVLTDILMPVMDGLQMAQAIKNINETTPIIVTTAYNEQDHFIRAVGIGIDEYVIKPINADALLVTLTRSGEKLRQRRETEASHTFAQFMLDMHSTFMIATSGGTLEFINRAFLNYLGFSSLDEFNRHHHCISDFFISINDMSYEENQDSANWMERLIREPQSHPIVHIRPTHAQKAEAFAVTHTLFPSIDRRIFSFVDPAQLARPDIHTHECNTPER